MLGIYVPSHISRGSTMPEIPVLLDTNCPDTFCSGIAKIDRLSGNLLRLVIYSEHPTANGKEWVVVAKLIMSASIVPSAVRQIAFAIGERGAEFSDTVTRLM